MLNFHITPFLQAILAVELMSKESIYGFHDNKKIHYLKIYVALQKLIAPARRILETSFMCPGFGERGYQTFESNIDFVVSVYFIYLFLKSFDFVIKSVRSLSFFFRIFSSIYDRVA